jgi:hypothetical protein
MDKSLITRKKSEEDQLPNLNNKSQTMIKKENNRFNYTDYYKNPNFDAVIECSKEEKLQEFFKVVMI